MIVFSKVAARGTLQRMKVRGEKTEEEDEVVEANADDNQAADHLEQEDPRHSMYHSVSFIHTTCFNSDFSSS